MFAQHMGVPTFEPQMALITSNIHAIQPSSSATDKLVATSTPPIRSIAAKISMRVSPFQPKLRRKNDALAHQRDTCAVYVLELEGRPTVEEYKDQVKAHAVAKEQIYTLGEKVTGLSATCHRQIATIAANNRQIWELQNDHERTKAALEKLRGKRRADRKAVEDWSHKVVGLEETCKTQGITIAVAHKEISDLEDKVDVLTESLTDKDEQMVGLRAAFGSATIEYEAELTKQRNVHRQLSEQYTDERKDWEEIREYLNRGTWTAQAETRNNHANWIQTLREKYAVISGLEITLSAATTKGDLTKHTKHVIKTHQDLRKKNTTLSKDNKALKTDIQNLLDTTQSKQALLTSYLKKIETLQAERTDANDRVVQLIDQLERRNKHAGGLQRIIATAAPETSQDDISCNVDCVPRAVVNKHVAEDIVDYYTQAEQLRHQLQQEQEARRDIQARLDQCDNDLFKYQTDEYDRLADVKRLERKVMLLEEEQKNLEGQIRNRNALISAIDATSHPQVLEIHRLLREQLHPLQLENRKLIAEKCNLLNEVDRHKERALETNAKCERRVEAWKSNYQSLEVHYWDVAVNERDHLHEELAHWKKKCSKEHFYESAPSSRLVHDRRLLQFALREGNPGLDRNMLPKEYFDPEFLRGCHSAVGMALRKLWPDFWQYLEAHAAWVPLTVPIVMDDATRAASDTRLEEFEEELRLMDGKLEEAHRKTFDIEDDSDSDDDKIVYEEGDSDHSNGSNEANTRSNPPGSARTNDTSPPSSKRTSPKPPGEAAEGWMADDQLGGLVDTQENDELPAFAKKIFARISAQQAKNEHLAGYTLSHHTLIDEHAFLARHGQATTGKSHNPTSSHSTRRTHEEADAHSDTSHNPSEQDVNAALVKETNTHSHAEHTLEQQVAIAYVEGEHNTFSRPEYDSFDDDMKERYRAAMVEVVVEEGMFWREQSYAIPCHVMPSQQQKLHHVQNAEPWKGEKKKLLSE